MPISGRHSNGKTIGVLKIQNSVIFEQVYCRVYRRRLNFCYFELISPKTKGGKKKIRVGSPELPDNISDLLMY